MKKLLSVLVAALFAVVSASAFSAQHTGAPMKDEKKMEKKEKKAKSEKVKKASKKKSEKIDKMDKK